MKNLVLKAIQFASSKHKGQERRGTGLPYVTHPMIVMELVQQYKGDSKHLDSLKCCALLHDTIEDTDCTYHELEREFSPMIASIVLELTSDAERIKEVGKNVYLKNKMLGMSQYAFTLKLLDRLSNVMDNPSQKYVEDTKEMVVFLRKNRDHNTERHERIFKRIYDVCKSVDYKELCETKGTCTSESTEDSDREQRKQKAEIINNNSKQIRNTLSYLGVRDVPLLVPLLLDESEDTISRLAMNRLGDCDISDKEDSFAVIESIGNRQITITYFNRLKVTFDVFSNVGSFMRKVSRGISIRDFNAKFVRNLYQVEVVKV